MTINVAYSKFFCNFAKVSTSYSLLIEKDFLSLPEAALASLAALSLNGCGRCSVHVHSTPPAVTMAALPMLPTEKQLQRRAPRHMRLLPTIVTLDPRTTLMRPTPNAPSVCITLPCRSTAFQAYDTHLESHGAKSYLIPTVIREACMWSNMQVIG